jgi:GAF domain-containing protein/HAMP domain-containing protein
MSMPTKVETPKASRSLTVTLALAFLALSVVVLLIAGGLQIFFNFQTQREIVASKQQLVAQEAANAVAGFIQEKFSMLGAAVRLGIPIHASPEQQKEVLDSLLGLEPAFRQVVLLDAQGQELASTSRLSQMASGELADRMEGDLLAQTSQGSRYVGPVYIDDITSEPLVIMAVPVTNIFGDVQGTLMAEANLKFMWDLVDRLEVGETGLAYVVDRQGNLIAFGDISRVLRGENVSNLEEVGEFIGSSASEDPTPSGVSPGINGTTAVTAYAPLGMPDWAVVAELPVSEAYQEVIRGGVISLVVTLAMGVLAGLIGAFMARRLAAPLLGLTQTATRIAGGEMGLQAAPEGPAEVVSLAQAFNHMTEQLRDLIRSLEARGRALETSAEVSRRLSTILDQKQLVAEVVEQVQRAFDYYHAHIYLVDEASDDPSTGSPAPCRDGMPASQVQAGQALVMAGGTGEAGRAMLAGGHRITQGRGLVGRAAETREVVLVPNVSQEEDWLPNPLLPDTRAEVAVPIMAGERVLGVLDVQHNVAGGLGQDDAELLESIAGQVAVALQNTRLFAETRQKAEREARANLISQTIQRTTSLESLLQVAARELGEGMGAQRVSIHLAPSPEGDHRRE